MSHIAVHVDYTSLLKKLNEKGITGYTCLKGIRFLIRPFIT